MSSIAGRLSCQVPVKALVEGLVLGKCRSPPRTPLWWAVRPADINIRTATVFRLCGRLGRSETTLRSGNKFSLSALRPGVCALPRGRSIGASLLTGYFTLAPRVRATPPGPLLTTSFCQACSLLRNASLKRRVARPCLRSPGTFSRSAFPERADALIFIRGPPEGSQA